MSKSIAALFVEHKLSFPIDGIKVVTVNPTERHQIIKNNNSKEKNKDNNLFCLMTGLTKEQRESLSYPDYITLTALVNEYNTLDSYALDGEVRDVMDFELKLKWPYKFGTTITVKPPTVAVSEMSDLYTDNDERTMFLMENLTGLNESDILSLKYPDYLSVLSLINDFLGKGAAYFVVKTSKS